MYHNTNQLRLITLQFSTPASEKVEQVSLHASKILGLRSQNAWCSFQPARQQLV